MAKGRRMLAILPVAVAALAVGAILSEPLPAPLGYIGPVTGEPEKDTYGHDMTGRAPQAHIPHYSKEARFVGPRSGDPERDTFGLVVLRGDPGALAAAD